MQLRLTLDPATGEGNLARDSNRNLLVDDGLETVVTIMLFTDARASAEDGVAKTEERRGYLFDGIDDDDATPLGSKLWIWQGRTLTTETMRGVESAAKDALAPLISSGVASAVDASLVRIGDETGRLVVTITGPTGDTIYQREWELRFALQ